MPDQLVPVTARDPQTGEQVRVEVSEALRRAIQAEIGRHVAGEAAPRPPVFDPDTLLVGAVLDTAVVVVAVLMTVVSPTSVLTPVLWVAAAAMAAKTVAQSVAVAAWSRSGR